VSQGRAVAVRELWFAAAALRAPRRSRAALDRAALRRIRAMLDHARAGIAYYGGPEYDVRLDTLADVARMPLLRKETLLALGVERFHAPLRGWVQEDLTSGTSGQLLRVRHDAGAYGYHGATLLRRFLMAGYRPWWTIAHIKPFPRPRRWFQRFGLFRRTVIHAGLPDRALVERILAARPHVIMAYPVMLRALLRGLSAEELARLRGRLRLVLTESELLTDDVRTLLADRFAVPVRDEYSAFEVLTVACQCRHGSMHIDEDRVHVEIVDDDGRPVPDGVDGVVVVTHFRERAMPLPRYLLGDRAIRLSDRCPCGSTFRRLVLTQGRSEDHVRLPGGRRIYIGTFLAMSKGVPGIAEFMVRQDETGAVTVLIVPDGTRPFEELAGAIADMLADHLGDRVPLRIAQSGSVALTPGGKARLIQSSYRPDRNPP
jgi:phenylacetate-CoA ligase